MSLRQQEAGGRRHYIFGLSVCPIYLNVISQEFDTIVHLQPCLLQNYVPIQLNCILKYISKEKYFLLLYGRSFKQF